MADCPLADECPAFAERIQGMGCTHYGDRGGKEWCKHYSQPIDDLKTQPVKRDEELVVEVTDIHESGAGVGRTEDGFIILVDGLLPDARARIRVTRVHNNHARAEVLERLPMDPDPEADRDGDETGITVESGDAREGSDGRNEDADDGDDGPRLGSRENFWG